MKKWQYIVMAIVLITLVLGLSVALYIYLSTDNKEPNNEIEKAYVTTQKIEVTIDDKDPLPPGNYLNETCYDGTQTVNQKLYSIPFSISPSYISNLSLYNQKGIEFLNTNMEVASGYMDTVFNITYKEIVADPNAYIDTFSNWYGEYVNIITSEEEVTPEYYAEQMVDWFVTNKVQIESEFSSDKSLVFYASGSLFVRGELKFTIYSCDDIERLEKDLKCEEIEIGNVYTKIIQVELVPSAKDSTKYRVNGVDVL